MSGSAYSGGHCVAPGGGEQRVSASPGSERDALCDAVVAAEAGGRNRKSVVFSSDCDFDSRSSSLCAVTSRPRSVCCARMNSRWNTHAARVNSQGLHSARGNSGGHINSYRCTYNSCGGIRGGTKPMSMSTRYQVGCPAVEKPASLQQAPGRLHVETWAGRNGNPSLPISQVVGGDSPSPSFLLFVSPGPGREVRNGIAWSLLEKTARSGVWLFRGALRGSSAFFAFVAFADWVKKRIVPYGVGGPSSFFVFLFILVWARHGCRATIWRAVLATASRSVEAIAPPMKPWCAEGDVPTAANLNLYRGRFSNVGWHSDDEPLFGKRGETKLIVSVSFGTQALFKWKGKSCPNNDGHSCSLGHGDILVMDGQCQDEFRHYTDLLFLSKDRSGMLFANVCAGFSFSGTELAGKGCFLAFWSPWCLVHPGGTSFGGYLSCVYKVWLSKMCLMLDTPCGRRSVGALSLLPLGSLLGSTKNCQSDVFWVLCFSSLKAVYASFSGTAQSP